MQFRVILPQKLVRRFLSIQKTFLERLRLNKNMYVVRQQCIQMNKFNTAKKFEQCMFLNFEFRSSFFLFKKFQFLLSLGKNNFFETMPWPLDNNTIDIEMIMLNYIQIQLKTSFRWPLFLFCLLLILHCTAMVFQELSK